MISLLVTLGMLGAGAREANKKAYRLLRVNRPISAQIVPLTREPLSAFLGKAARPSAPTPDFPVWIEGSQFNERFFSSNQSPPPERTG